MTFQVQGLSVKASHCRLDHPDLAISTAGGVLVHLLEVDGCLHVMIDVSETATYDDLVAGGAVSLALKWRDAVRAWQGTCDPAVSFIERLLAANQGELYYHEGVSRAARRTAEVSELADELVTAERRSYRELADEINQRLAELVIEHSALERRRQDILAKMDAAEPPIRTINEIWASEWAAELMLLRYGPLQLDQARDLLSIVSTMSPEEIDELLNTAVARAGQGEPPFDPDYPPIERESLKQTLHNWRKKRLPRLTAP